MLRSLRAVCLAAVIAALPATARAQSGLSIWAGMGGSSSDGNVTFGKEAKQLGVQLGLPIIPVAVRGDALMFGSKFDTDALSYSVNGVLQMRLPVVQPYAILGRGRYATSPTEKTTGWNYGAGLRVGVGRFGIFGELRRHDPIGRTVTTLGVTF